MDELAVALRHRPDRAADPQRAGRRPGDAACRFSTRNLVACLREGAERFGWAERDPRPARGATAAGWSAPASRPRPTRPTLAPAQARAPRATPDGALRRADRRRRHRHRRPHRAAPRSPPTRSASPLERGDGRDRRQRPARGAGWPAARWARPRGAGRCVKACRGAARAARRARRRVPDGRARGHGRHRRGRRGARAALAATRSARSSPRCASTPTPARSGCRGCSACSPPAASSTRRPRARSSSAA